MKNAPSIELKKTMDLETGEIIESLVGDIEDFTFISNESIKKKQEHKKNRLENSNFNILTGGFIFTMMNTLKELIADTTFTQAEKTRIMFLGTYVSYDKNSPREISLLSFPILKNQLMELLEMTNRKEFYAFYNKLVEADVITEDVIDRSTVKLIWSKQYHFKGKTTSGSNSSQNMVKTYDNQIREMYTEKDAKGKAVHTAHSLFNVFTLMPYVHPVSNALCKYPDNPVHASEPFTLKELAGLFGYQRSNDLKRMLFKIKLHKIPVVAIAETSEGTNIFINPFLVNRTGKTPNATLFTMFDSSFNILADRKKWSDKEKQDFLMHL